MGLLKFGALFTNDAQELVNSLNFKFTWDNQDYVNDFEKQFDLPEVYVVEQAESLINLGFVPKKHK